VSGMKLKNLTTSDKRNALVTEVRRFARSTWAEATWHEPSGSFTIVSEQGEPQIFQDPAALLLVSTAKKVGVI